MATSASYDADSQLGAAASLYANQNGETPSTQQPPPPHAHGQAHTDPDLQLQERLQHLQQGTEMLHAATQGHTLSAALGASHHQFQTPPRPTHSPQQMAQSVISLDGHDLYSDHDGSSRKRSKVSRACDECRRKKVWLREPARRRSIELTTGRFGATPPVRMGLKLAQAVSGRGRGASSVGSL